MNNLLVLTLPTLYVGIPLDQVVRILPLAWLQEIPESPPWFLGLLNLEGQTIPVFDLTLRLGLGDPPPYQLSTPIVILSWENKQVGMIVQEVLGVRPIPNHTLLHTDLFQNNGPPFLGVVRTPKESLILVLDPARLQEIPLELNEPIAANLLPQLLDVLQSSDTQ